MAQFTDGKETRVVPDALVDRYEARGWTRLDAPKVAEPEPEPQPEPEPEPEPTPRKRAKRSDPSDDFDTLGPGSVTDGLDD